MRRRHLITATGVAAAAAPLAAVTPAQAAPAQAPSRGVTTGAQIQATADWQLLRGQRVGVVTNPTGVLHDLTSIVDHMHAARVDLVGVFGPEHGFRGTAQAGGSEGTFTDPRTGLTVYDTYGASTEKLAAMLTTARVETLVFDIQDAGSRFYTYIWTMYQCMAAAVRVGARFVVLDRPNPTGGAADGPMMFSPYQTFVGLKEIVQQHGMTVGELARFFDGEFLPRDEGKRLRDLTVVEMKGWRRDVRYDDTGLQWVMPSPNMPTPTTALVYPGTCMFEGTNLSEGRGTTRPFELIGAPFVDHRLAERLNARQLPGVRFREAYFTPTISKHANKVCGGVQLHVTDAYAFEPIRTGVEMLVALKALYPDVAWRKDNATLPYWIDKLTGSARLREQIDAGATADQVQATWRAELAEFKARRRQYLIYNGPAR